MHSMTGYGRGTAARDGREITLELKTVNHRFLDVSMRLPRHIAFLEDALRQGLSARLSRGHVDLTVSYRNFRTDARRVVVDEALLSAYLAAARALTEPCALADDLTVTAALRLPDVMDVREADEDREPVTALALEALSLALDELTAMRHAEGERLRSDLATRTDTIAALTASVSERAPLVIEEYRVKLTDRIEQLLGKTEVDRARLATEVALFADKASIDEELTRLNSHLVEIRKLFETPEPSGRRLDFIVQELNREFNTIGSKANDAELTRLVLLGKAEIEKVREQVQNIE